MQLGSVLSIELIQQLKSITRKPKVIRLTTKGVYKSCVYGSEGRRIPGGLRPRGLSQSNLLPALESAQVFGVKTRI